MCKAGKQTGTGGNTYSREEDKPASIQADTWKELGRRTGVTGADRHRRVLVQAGRR
jgi:hypothetical protein